MHEFLLYLKEEPLFNLGKIITILVLFIFFTNLCCSWLGVTLCMDSYFLLYLFILTKVILVNTIISLFFLAIIRHDKEWFNIVSMSLWLPVALIFSSFFYYFYVLPHSHNS